MLSFLLSAALTLSPVTHTDLLPDGTVLQVHQDLSITFTTIESVLPPMGPVFEPGEVVYEWKNAEGVTCRARVDCVTIKYEDCVERAVKLRKIMQKYDPVPKPVEHGSVEQRQQNRSRNLGGLPEQATLPPLVDYLAFDKPHRHGREALDVGQGVAVHGAELVNEALLLKTAA